MLADPYRLEGEGDVAWTPTAAIHPASVLRVVGELERGLLPTRPPYLKWICDKLSALPTQNGTGLNAAIWADNVIDTCGHYPEDLLQAATLELLRTKTFRPSPAEIVAVIEPHYSERQRMLDRAKSMEKPAEAAASKPAPKCVPEAERLRKILADQRARTDIPEEHRLFNVANTERALALCERRPMEAWAAAFFEARATTGNVAAVTRAVIRDTTRAMEVAATTASQPKPWKAGDPVYVHAPEEPPPPTEIPEAPEFEP